MCVSRPNTKNLENVSGVYRRTTGINTPAFNSLFSFTYVGLTCAFACKMSDPSGWRPSELRAFQEKECGSASALFGTDICVFRPSRRDFML